MAHGGAGPPLPQDRAGGGGFLSPRRGPQWLPGIVDSHCHLQHDRFDVDREAVLERAVEAGIERIMVPGWDVASSEAALELAGRHPGLVQAAVGIHPHRAAQATERDWTRVEDLAADERCAAIGEIGLDFHRNLSPPDRQRDALGRQLTLAKASGRPVLVHDREAHDAVTSALLEWQGSAGHQARGVLHAFSGDAAMATRLAAAGFLMSFALPITFRSAAGPRAAVASLPIDALLVETDAPYLGPDAAGRNEPVTVLRVVSELARLRGEKPYDVAAAIRSAYERLLAR